MAKRKFAFIIHPRDISDVGRLVGKMIGIGENMGIRLLPEGPAEWMIERLPGRLGFGVTSHFRVTEDVEGYLVCVYLTARQMLALPRKEVVGRIMDAILYAQDTLGCERIGLGAYTAPMLCNGRTVTKEERFTCSITHGDALSAASAVPAVIRGAELQKINLQESTIAVVGAYGLVGRAAAIMLADLAPKRLIMTGPNPNKLQKAAEEMRDFRGELRLSTDNWEVQGADVVVLCTTANGDVITPDMLKSNALVVDMAQPHNMSAWVSKMRPDVLRLDGGFMSIPGVNLGFDMGTPWGTTFACLTETMVSTMFGVTDNHVGAVDVDYARQVLEMARRVGFVPTPPTSFANPIWGRRGCLAETW